MNVLRRRMFQQGGPVTAPEAAQTALAEQGVQQVMGQINAEIDNSQDFEEMINATRGDNAPIEQRYQELATIVGPEDAMQTPESVLALAQPVIENTLVDQGIGGLAQEEMSVPVGPEMTSGIMEMTEQPVQQFQEGGAVSLKDYYQKNLPLIQEVMGSGDAKERAKGQALLDIAQRAFLYGSGVNPATGQPYGKGQSEAQKLAGLLASATTPIGEQLAAYNKLQQEEKLKALEMGISQKAAADAAAAETHILGQGDVLVRGSDGKIIKAAPVQDSAFMEKIKYLDEFTTLSNEEKYLLAQGGPTDFMNKQKVIEYLVKQGVGTEEEISKKVFNIDQGPVKDIPRDIFDNLPKVDQEALVLNQGPVKGIPRDLFNGLSADMQSKILVGNPENVLGIPRDVWDTLSEEEKKRKINDLPNSVKNIPLSIWKDLPEETKNNILDPTSVSPVNGIPRDIYNDLSPVDQANLVIPEKDVKGIPRGIFDNLTADQQAKALGLVDQELTVKGVPISIYNTLSQEEKIKLLQIEDRIKDVPMELFNRLDADKQARLLGIADPNLSVKGIPIDIFNELSPDEQKRIMGTVEKIKGLDKTIFDTFSSEEQKRFLQIEAPTVTIKGVPEEMFNRFDAVQQARILGVDAKLERIENKVNGKVTLLDLSKPEGERIVYESEENGLVRELKDGSIVQLFTTKDATTNQIPEPIILHKGSRDIRVVDGKAVDFTDYQEDLKLIAAGTLEGPPRPPIVIMEKEITPKDGQNIYIPSQNKIVLSFDGGKTYTKDGQTINLDPTDAVDIGNNTAYDSIATIGLREKASNELNTFFQNGVFNNAVFGDSIGTATTNLTNAANGTNLNNTFLSQSPNTQANQPIKGVIDPLGTIHAINTYDAAYLGTGVQSRILAGMDAAFGGLTSYFGKDQISPATQEARQVLRELIVLGRAAFINNPRFPVAEMLKAEGLFPQLDGFGAWFANPATSQQKIRSLKRLAINRYHTNLIAISQGGASSDKIQDHLTQNTEIKNLLLFLKDVPLGDEVVIPNVGEVNTGKSGVNTLNTFFGEED